MYKSHLYRLKWSNLFDSVRANLFTDNILLYWSHSKGGTFNFGDILNPYLVEALTGQKCINLKDIYLIKNRRKFTCIGSVLDQNIRFGGFEVWGSGFIRKPDNLPYTPSVVHAVRGPLSRDVYESFNIDCPPVYGDPAILLPRLYNPDIAIKHKVGIVPHYTELEHPSLKTFLNNNEDVKLISVLNGVEAFVDDILSCERILSSSLHGLIASDAYNIPNKHVVIGDKLHGGRFKFVDYYSSVNNRDYTAISLTDAIRTENIRFESMFDKVSELATGLLASCPLPVLPVFK
ncbi:pyruvyl transferase [Lewinella marina]|nr:polysaccharide pyruvyl transferase family protein [Neolewinella marina]NJB86681.1 pyruvyl transferase [Neolewinella marina]